MARWDVRSFVDELKRRRVFRAGAAYAIAAWLIVQAASIILPTFNAPLWVQQVLIILVTLGFFLTLLTAWTYKLTPEDLDAAQEYSEDSPPRRARWHLVDFLVVGVLLAAIGILAANLYWVFEGSADVPVEAGDSMPAVARLENSVAVLPFVNLSPDPNNAYFAAGIHEEVLNYLTKIRSLNVIARTTMMQYEDTDKSILQVADDLNVETVMEGSVRYAGDRVRVTVQLIDAKTESHLLSEAYERDLDDIFAIQADIAMNVANALEAEFSVTDQERLVRAPTVSPASYTLYLQYLNLIGSDNQGAQALTMLDQIIEDDPAFAEPYGQKAYIYVNMMINTVVGRAGERNEIETLVRTNAERSLELDPYGFSAHSALALLNAYTWDWSEARRIYDSYRSATGDVATWHEWFATWNGQDRTAIEIASEYAALNPLDYSAPWRLGLALISAGAYQAAADAFRESIALAPALAMLHSWLAWAEIAVGNNDDALEELRVTEQLLGNTGAVISLLDTAYGYARLGHSQDVRRIAEEILQRSNELDLGAGGWAMFYLATGDTDSALQWLQTASEKAQAGILDEGFLTLMVLKENVTNDPVLNRPEFVAVRRSLIGQ